MRLFLLCLLLLSAPALAAWPADDYADQTSTDSGPSVSTDGLPMIMDAGAPVRGYSVAVCATSGQTLSGVGYLRAWVYMPGPALWMRSPDLDVQVSLSGKRCQSSADFAVAVFKSRRVYYATEGVTTSSGGLRVWILRSTTM